MRTHTHSLVAGQFSALILYDDIVVLNINIRQPEARGPPKVPVAESDDPTVICQLVVHADDVVTAMEANLRGNEGAVLRATPPFSGRMRARLHREGTEYDDSPTPVHVAPVDLVEGTPPYPTPDDTEDELRADPDLEYTPERHRERHVRRVQEWRETVREHFADEVVLDTPAGAHRVGVVVLG